MSDPTASPQRRAPSFEGARFGDELAQLQTRLDAARAYLRYDDLRREMDRLAKEVESPDLWSDPDRAREVTTAFGRVRADLDAFDALSGRLDEATGLHEIAEQEGPMALASIASDLTASITDIERSLRTLELQSLFSGEHDERDAVCEIHAGAGGTDAQDWAEMMLRMYERWAERHGFSTEVNEVTEGQEAGILSATFIVRGRYAFGLLTAERGVHRLVRMSPFDSQHRRHTSFSSLEATPFLDDVSGEVSIDDKDLRIDTYRSSGAGGQHVNVTDSAVRITHLPSGIVVAVQNERSQHQNRAKAMQILAAKLAERQREERRAELLALSGPQTNIEWGNQIRSYVLAPYQLVKDLRTDYETGNVDAVLDGDLDEFMFAYLRWRRENEGA
ncbi:MAG: peptide chain release factor 2 [Acidimicrobiales bacterium]